MITFKFVDHALIVDNRELLLFKSENIANLQCHMCNPPYVGYTARHLHHCINEHKYSAIGRHLEQHGLLKTDLIDKQFSVLKKRRSKFDCLIFEMLFIKEFNPKLNTQRLHSSQTLYVTLQANILSLSLHIFTFYSCVLGILLHLYSFSFYSFLIW